MQGYQTEGLLETPGFDNLRQFVRKHLVEQPGGGDFQRFESELHDLVAKCEREIVASKLASYDVKAEAIQVGGIVHRKVLDQSPETYISSAGEVTVERNLFRADGKSRAICPLELRAGIIDGLWTPRAARQAAYAMAHLTSNECENLFDELGNMTPSHSSLDRLPKTLSETWEEHGSEWEDALNLQESIPRAAVTVAVSLDGVMVPIKASEYQKTVEPASQTSDAAKAAKKEGTRQPTPAVYKEASCGTVSFYDKEGELLKTLYFARMPEAKKRTLTEQLDATLRSFLEARPDLRTVYLADGSEENWRFFKTLDDIPHVDTLDFWHAAEHLKTALDAYYGEKSAQSRADFESLKVILKEEEGGVDQVIRALKYRHKAAGRKAKKAIGEELTYFRNQRSRMNYAASVRDKLPIGSGVVEAGCKTMFLPRLKRSGQSWSIRGGQGVLTLRSLIKSERWERGWRLLSKSYTGAVVALETRRRHLALVQKEAA